MIHYDLSLLSFYHFVKYYHISAEKRETGMSSSNVVEQRFFHLESVPRFFTRKWEAARKERPDFMFVGFIEQRAVCSVSSVSSEQ